MINSAVVRQLFAEPQADDACIRRERAEFFWVWYSPRIDAGLSRELWRRGEDFGRRLGDWIEGPRPALFVEGRLLEEARGRGDNAEAKNRAVLSLIVRQVAP
jgi:hypothetical protein